MKISLHRPGPSPSLSWLTALRNHLSSITSSRGRPLPFISAVQPLPGWTRLVWVELAVSLAARIENRSLFSFCRISVERDVSQQWCPGESGGWSGRWRRGDAVMRGADLRLMRSATWTEITGRKAALLFQTKVLRTPVTDVSPDNQ